jgi:antitoxin component YwqK of YwqJK toxin-antitoxin module
VKHLIIIFCFLFLCLDTSGQDFSSEITYLNKKELDYDDRNRFLSTGSYWTGDKATGSFNPFTGVIYLHCSIKDVIDTLCNNCKYEYYKDSIYVSEEYTYYIGGRLDMTTTKYSDGSYEEKIYKVRIREDGSKCMWCDYLERAWYKNGQIKSEKFVTYGTSIGPHRAWYENGQKRFDWYFNESRELEGKYQKWNGAGQLTHELHFKNGKKDGLCRWYENGQLESEGHLKNNEHVGVWKYFHENGKLKLEVHYKNDVLVSIKEWDDNGDIMQLSKWRNKNELQLSLDFTTGKEKYTLNNKSYSGSSFEDYPNGNIKCVTDYKEGFIESKKCWDEDGNETEWEE